MYIIAVLFFQKLFRKLIFYIKGPRESRYADFQFSMLISPSSRKVNPQLESAYLEDPLQTNSNASFSISGTTFGCCKISN